MKDAVDRLTPLGLIVLALLAEGDMHPYEMMRLLRMRRDDRLVTITNGTMYHTVARLEREGLVAEVGVDRDGNRPERTTYTVTDAGTRAVSEWVRRELPRIDRPAPFRIAGVDFGSEVYGIGMARDKRRAGELRHWHIGASVAAAAALGALTLVGH